jgi:hypothetical protein
MTLHPWEPPGVARLTVFPARPPTASPCRSCLNWEPDDKGINGMVLTKDLPSEAALCLNKAISRVAPLIMSWGQYAEAAAHFAKDFYAIAM